MKKPQKMTNAELRYALTDIGEAIAAMPLGHKVEQYIQDARSIQQEIERRSSKRVLRRASRRYAGSLVPSLRDLSRDASYRLAGKKYLDLRENPRSRSRSRSRYRHVAMRNPHRDIDPRSIRTIRIGKHGKLLRVGCPKGAYKPRKRRCRKGMRALTMLIPKRKRRKRKNYGRHAYLSRYGKGWAVRHGASGHVVSRHRTKSCAQRAARKLRRKHRRARRRRARRR